MERFVIRMTFTDGTVQWIGKGPWDYSEDEQSAYVMSRPSALGKLRIWRKRVEKKNSSLYCAKANIEVLTAVIQVGEVVDL